MIHDFFYMISPSEELRAAVEGAREDLKNLLGSAVLWRGQFSDKGPMTPVDAAQLIKGLFLLSISDMPDARDLIKSENAGKFHISSELFDKYWSIDRIYEDNSVKEAILEYADRPEFEDFLGNLGENWSIFVKGVINKA